eukprot:gene28846-37853_t
MAWARLVNVFENKLGWASILAMQKGISFEVSDKTVASEFGLPDTMSVADEENGLVVVTASSPDGATKGNLLGGWDSSHSAIATADISPEKEDVVKCDNEIIYEDSTPRLAINFELLDHDKEDKPAPLRVLIVVGYSMLLSISSFL